MNTGRAGTACLYEARVMGIYDSIEAAAAARRKILALDK
jgi:hypothetical protein